MSKLTRGFGYIPQLETPELIQEQGMDNDKFLCSLKDAQPTYPVLSEDNPEWIEIINQGNMGSCVGASLCGLTSVLHAQHTGHLEKFSVMGAYLKSQQIAGLKGDRGSTISAAQKLMNTEGIALDADFPYPSRYSSRLPQGYVDFPKVQLLSSKLIEDVDLAFEILNNGGALHFGVMWGRECELDKCTRYSGRGGGGHAVYCYGLKEDNPQYARMFNSWSERFGNNGTVLWKDTFIRDVLKHRWSVCVGYSVGDTVIDDKIYED